MEISQWALAVIALYSIAVGFSLGGVYDVFRILRIAAGAGAEESGGTGHPKKSAASASFKDKIHGCVVSVLRAAEDIIIFIEDILFAVISAVAVTVFIFNINDGQVRGFALAGTAFGFIIYYLTVGRLVMFCTAKIIAFVRAVVLFILRLTIFPLFGAFSAILRLLRDAAVYLRGNITRLIRKRNTKNIMRFALREAETVFVSQNAFKNKKYK